MSHNKEGVATQNQWHKRRCDPTFYYPTTLMVQARLFKLWSFYVDGKERL